MDGWAALVGTFTCSTHKHSTEAILSGMEGEAWLLWCSSGRIAGCDYLASSAHSSAESSTGTNVNVCTNDVFTRSVDTLVFQFVPANEEMKVA